jgi:hypothetical protein
LEVMELRNHPLMSVRGHRSWPPVWVWIGGRPDQHPEGEIGVLKAVRHTVRPPIRWDRLFLVMEDADALYVGCILLDDEAFCESLFHKLNDHLGKSVEQIGELDVSSAF